MEEAAAAAAEKMAEAREETALVRPCAPARPRPRPRSAESARARQAGEVSRLQAARRRVRADVGAALARRGRAVARSAAAPSTGEGAVLARLRRLVGAARAASPAGGGARATALAEARAGASEWVEVDSFVRPWRAADACGARARDSAGRVVGPGLCAALRAMRAPRAARGAVRFRTALAAAESRSGGGARRLPSLAARALARLDAAQAALNRRRLRLYLAHFGAAPPAPAATAAPAAGAIAGVAGAVLRAVGLAPPAPAAPAAAAPAAPAAGAARRWHAVARVWDALGRAGAGELRVRAPRGAPPLPALARAELAAGAAAAVAEGSDAARARAPRARRGRWLVGSLDAAEAALLGAQARLGRAGRGA